VRSKFQYSTIISSTYTYGYRSGSSFLKNLCLDNDIIFVQEHWLFKSQLHLFNDLVGSDFCFSGDSAMNRAQECRILGVGILWRS